jgi:hypothetical protein
MRGLHIICAPSGKFIFVGSVPTSLALYNIAYQTHQQAPAERFIETLEAWQQAWRAKVQAEHDYEEAVRCE